MGAWCKWEQRIEALMECKQQKWSSQKQYNVYYQMEERCWHMQVELGTCAGGPLLRESISVWLRGEMRDRATLRSHQPGVRCHFQECIYKYSWMWRMSTLMGLSPRGVLEASSSGVRIVQTQGHLSGSVQIQECSGWNEGAHGSVEDSSVSIEKSCACTVAKAKRHTA
ncbi:uncharacterized protein LOC118453895 isoform X2 [Neolamprologus brichardi]|nr:uncharacterized protein LOC118453895 isoform X2 [Neolamprologus brichardi]XP_035761789.1 uncharacterized protein LOC118453895 isoform X2 [Neolamprologus brichardi]XP_035761797.1 uncharacterized protein LOC118453895 isoform X2 [Neolamprologus brichardi]XP_035761801.1 uncharacterized protein LOC118453895 isoform X2 [Neolamprologus brichardi]